MDYKQLAESAYKVVKHLSQWNNQDIKRINRIKKILQKEIEKELESVGLIPDDGTIVSKTIESIPAVTEIPTQPQSLMERVFTEEDANLDKEIIQTTPKEKTQEVKKVSSGEPKRYFLTIVSNGILKKPAYQIFKGEDIIEKDFQTDRITNSQFVYYAVVDGNLDDITSNVKSCFINPYLSNTITHDADWVPPQYVNIWQNKTTIK